MVYKKRKEIDRKMINDSKINSDNDHTYLRPVLISKPKIIMETAIII